MGLKIKNSNAIKFNLMPFLDILFCSIGIFIIIFCFQNFIEQQTPTNVKADVIVLCLGENTIRWVDDTNSYEIEYEENTVSNWFKNYHSGDADSINLIVAIKPKAYHLFYHLDQLLTKMVSGKDKSKILINKTLWPLNDIYGSEEELLKIWSNSNSQ